MTAFDLDLCHSTIECKPLLLDVGRWVLICLEHDRPAENFQVNRWLSMRFNLLSSLVIGLTGGIAVYYPSISAALAGFALSFSASITHNVRQISRTVYKYGCRSCHSTAALVPGATFCRA